MELGTTPSSAGSAGIQPPMDPKAYHALIRQPQTCFGGSASMHLLAHTKGEVVFLEDASGEVSASSVRDCIRRTSC